MIIGRNLINGYYEDEKLYSTGDDYLDEMLEKAFCEGYEYAQKEFATGTRGYIGASLNGSDYARKQIGRGLENRTRDQISRINKLSKGKLSPKRREIVEKAMHKRFEIAKSLKNGEQSEAAYKHAFPASDWSHDDPNTTWKVGTWSRGLFPTQ